ncbi:phosphatidate cytidylyltransferase [Thermococcus profundus]|uniref:Phosphatidate cytidylyltransferase n=1 Tax=Thermococcus profundus TaxID=49899 RepID=A0A2Z2MAB4_THEPR|nr:phosphatidate cytidylyltransferase [Thermococcus profundus]ASJ03317.1 phosphatidate cytidylyltransferase [Thermococcus profundus]
MNRIPRKELIRKAWHVSPGILGPPIVLFTPRWVTLIVVWSLAFLYTLQHLKLKRGWSFTVPVAGMSYEMMVRESEADNYLGSFLFWVTLGIICTVFPKLPMLAALWVSTLGDCCNAIAGMSIGGPKLPWNPKKTIVGSTTMFITSLFAIWLAHAVLGSKVDWVIAVLVALVAALLESLPVNSAYDEFTVPFGTALLLWLAYRGPLLSPTW